MHSPRTYLLLAANAAISAPGVVSVAAELPDNDTFETIVVTSRLWEESPAAIPLSVDTIDVDTRIASLDRLDQTTTNIKIEDSSVQTRVAIRGVLGYDSSLQQPVGYYLDDIALPLGGSQLPALFNIKPVEIYKGPFGALYGRHAEGGVVKVTSLSPDWQTTGNLDFTTGVTDGANGYKPATAVAVTASTPLLTDVVAASAGLRFEKTDGTQLNLYDDSEEKGHIKNLTANVAFDARLSPDTLIAWRSHLSHKDSGKAGLRYLTGEQATPRFTINYNSDTFDEKDSDIHSLKITHARGELTFTSISGYTRYFNDFQVDLDLAAFPVPETLMNLDDEMFSQEFRVSGDQAAAIRWLAGFYYFEENTDVDFTIGGSALLARAQRITRIDQSGYAIFGQLDWEINDKLTLGVGARQEQINKDGSQHYSGLSTSDYQQDTDSSVFLPRASLRYAFNDQQQMYFSLASGYLPGGYNHTFAQNALSFTFARETSTGFELGYKANLLDNSLELAAALFNTQTKDKQIVDLQPGFVTAISNAAKATTSGIEINAGYTFNESLRGFISLGTMDASAGEYTVNVFNGSGFVENDLSGNSLPMAPEYTWSTGLYYTGKDNAGGWFGSVIASGSSKYYFDSNNVLEQPSYTILDATIGYQFNAFSVSLIADNLTDETIFSRSVLTNSGIVAEDTRARYYGINFSANW